MQDPRRLRILGTWLVTYLLYCSHLAWGEGACKPIPLGTSLRHLGSMAWIASEEKIALVDQLEDSGLFSIANDGSTEALEIPQLEQTFGVRYTSDGRAVALGIQHGSLRLLSIPDDSTRISLGPRSANREYQSSAPGYYYDWTILDEVLVGYGIARHQDEFIYGVYTQRIPTDRPAGAPFHLLDFEPPDYYLLNQEHSKMAPLGEAVYFLQLSPGLQPGLIEISPHKSLKIKNLGRISGSKPMPNFKIQEFQTKNYQGSVVRSTHAANSFADSLVDVPLGLYSDGQNLFVLQRSSAADSSGSSKIWELLQLDLGYPGIEISSRKTLPFSSPRLGVALSPEDWYFIEAGALQIRPCKAEPGTPVDWCRSHSEYLRQEISRMTRIPRVAMTRELPCSQRPL